MKDDMISTINCLHLPSIHLLQVVTAIITTIIMAAAVEVTEAAVAEVRPQLERGRLITVTYQSTSYTYLFLSFFRW